MLKKLNINSTFKKILILVVTILLILALGNFYLAKTQQKNIFSILERQDPSTLFLSEVYDKIKDNYWDNINDQDLTNLFQLASEKITKNPQLLEKGDKNGLIKMLTRITKNMDAQQKKEFAVNVTNLVLVSLKPNGRSALYTVKQEQNLKNLVQNIDPQKNLYKDLGISDNASPEAVNQAYKTKEEQLKNESSEEAKKQLAQAKYAKDILSNQDTKANYDQQKIEPTVFSKLVNPDTFYIQLKKISPTTLEEFQKAGNTYANKTTGPTSLIFDLRGNVGGAIDALPYFLGDFLGQDQYAFDFYHKGQYSPFKTTTNKLPGFSRYKQVIILIDNGTQSSAELMTASLKKYNFGIVVGLPTKGWGTVERVFPVDHQIDQSEKYSLFLVHSITLRDDGQPIEGRGVEPTINVNDPNWEKELYSYFHNPELTQTVKQIWNSKDNL